MDLMKRIAREPRPVRKAIQLLVRELNLGGYRFRYDIGAVHRPHYAYIVYQAAQLAARLGHERVSILEFGVAGGAGLLCLEAHAREVERIFPVGIDIYGFDTGQGLPPPTDYRDLPYHWKEGFFRMEPERLRARLTRAKLILGDIADTLPAFIRDHDPAPIGAMSQDTDFYSSTMSALGIFDEAPQRFLPRVFSYFDDVIGGDVELYGDFTGERLAIADFNAAHPDVKLSPLYYLTTHPHAPIWHHQIWCAHLFAHPDYGRFISQENQQIAI